MNNQLRKERVKFLPACLLPCVHRSQRWPAYLPDLIYTSISQIQHNLDMIWAQALKVPQYPWSDTIEPRYGPNYFLTFYQVFSAGFMMQGSPYLVLLPLSSSLSQHSYLFIHYSRDNRDTNVLNQLKQELTPLPLSPTTLHSVFLSDCVSQDYIEMFIPRQGVPMAKDPLVCKNVSVSLLAKVPDPASIAVSQYLALALCE